MSRTKRYRFRMGDHGLAEKRGHCLACSAAEAVITVRASSPEEALAEANKALEGLTAPRGAAVAFSVRGKLTMRNLVKGQG